MKKNQFIGIFLVAACWLQVVLLAADSVKIVKIEEVPEGPAATIKKQVGKAPLTEVRKVVEDGQSYYDASFGAQGRRKVLRVAASDGKLVYRQFFLPETPPAVRKTISQQAKGGKITRIVKTFDEDESTFEVKFNKRGKPHEFVVGLDGDLISRVLTMQETPKPVQATIRKEMGKGEVVQILKTIEEGEVFFQVDIVKEREQEPRTMNITADGTLASIQVFVNELPPKVQSTIRGELRGGKVAEVYKSFDEDGFTFELDIIRKDKPYAVSVNGDGTLIEAELELADTPEAVQKTMKEALADTEIDSIAKSLEEGEVIYVAEFTKNEKSQTLSVAADGKLLDQEMEIALSDAPEPVQKTIKEHAGKGDIEKVTRIIADKESAYEVEVADDQRSFTITVAGDGKLVSVEEEIPLGQAPAPVQKAITEQLGGGKLGSITKSVAGQKTAYDVEATKDGKTIYFSVDPSGKNVGERN